MTNMFNLKISLVERKHTEKLDEENTKSEENIPEFFQDKEKESEKSKE